MAAHIVLLYQLGLNIAQTLLALGAACFVIAIAFYCCMHRWGDEIFKGIKWLHHKIHEKKTSEENNSFSLSSRIADVTYNY